MEIKQSPMWLRAIQIIFGLIAIILSFWVIIQPPLTTFFILILFFAIGLLFIGLMAIFRGIFSKDLPGWLRALNIIVGILIIILMPSPFFEPILTAFLLLWLFAFGLIFYGLTNLMLGFAAPDTPGWYRALLIIFGFLLMIFGFQVIWAPIFGLVLAVWFLCFGLIFGGIELLIAGFTGQRPRRA
ncbi:MAG: DUF308 domain-containing protein [Candidatus Odinarchaeota archaeon]